MKFITICYGKEEDIEDWRAYFAEECDFDETDDPTPKHNAKVGYGDSTLQAIANLCLDEIVRIEEDQRQTYLYGKRMTPLTETEWWCIDNLYKEGTCWGASIVFHDKEKNEACWLLVDKGYVGRSSGFYISEEGIKYYETYSNNRQRIKYS